MAKSKAATTVSTTPSEQATKNLTMPPEENKGEKAEENMNSNKPLQKAFLDGLKDIYYSEFAIVEALPKMREAATTEELKDAFEDHELLTRRQITRLEKVFKSIKEEPEKKKCPAIEGIIKEGEEVIKSTPEGSMTRDAMLIIAAQKVEHYEIASYGGLAQMAITLGYNDAADLLERTLEEEEQTDLDLTDIAESFINFEAEEEDEDEESGDM